MAITVITNKLVIAHTQEEEGTQAHTHTQDTRMNAKQSVLFQLMITSYLQISSS